jgi:hypothetical protein
LENREIENLDEYFNKAFLQVKKLKNSNDEYAFLVEKEYESSNLFFLKNYLDMFKSENNDECLCTQIEKFGLLLEHAYRVFKDYNVSQFE